MEIKLQKTLPPLKENLNIIPSGIDFNHNPSWLIEDTITNQYFQINWQSYQILKVWQKSKSLSPQALIDQINQQKLITINEKTISDLLAFLSTNCLIKQNYHALKIIQSTQKNPPFFIWLMKNYLFFRIPLIHPNQMLNQIYPLMKFLLSRFFFIVMIIILILGLSFLSNQWDQFRHSFFDLFSIEYLIIYLIALIFAKVFHELGHALACKKYQLNVATMGVAFLVLFPMLYTDTQQSWRLKNHKSRLFVSISGVLMEFYLAIIALWLWMILPFGIFKSICFFLATYSLLTTILINISPFLRFDGYYVLSDLLSMRNLQTRSFAITRTFIRNTLFGLKLNYPEAFSNKKRVFLIVYAMLTWLYRFILFLGIALLVYYLFFKALGILLFFIEIYYFILKPIFNELRIWWQIKKQITINKHSVTFLSILIILIFLIIFPFKRDLRIPATLSFESQRIFIPENATITKIYVTNAQKVNQGDILLNLQSNYLNFKYQSLLANESALKTKLRNIGNYQSKNISKAVIESELNEIQQQIKQTQKALDKLTVKANISGIIDGISPGLKEGLTIRKDQALFNIYDKNVIKINAYATESMLNYLKINETAYFVPDNIYLKKTPVVLKKITYHPISNLLEDDTFNRLNYYVTKQK